MTCRINDVNSIAVNAMNNRNNKRYFTSSIVPESQTKMLPTDQKSLKPIIFQCNFAFMTIHTLPE